MKRRAEDFGVSVAGRKLFSVVLCVPALMFVTALSSAVVADEPAGKSAATGAEVPLGEFIDQQIRQGWSDNEIQASPVAGDEEWVRRVYLDLVGRIPTLTEAREFLADKNPRKRAI
ncbi:MAG: DUF1549 domain-containing protein, partial [Planctomycetaceae bacterium]